MLSKIRLERKWISVIHHVKKRRKLSQVQKAKWLRRMSELLEQGYSFMQVLHILAESASWKEKKWLQSISTALQQGKKMEDTFKEAGFSAHIVFMISQAELHGNLTDVLRKASDWKMKRVELQKEWQKILTYPLLLMFILSLMMYLILQLVMPQFMYLFETFDIDLPSSTLFLLTSVEWMEYYGLYVLIGLVSVVCICIWLLKQHDVREKVIHILLRVPGMRSIFQVIYSVVFSVQMGFLLQANVPLYAALQHMLKYSSSTYYQKSVQALEAEILRGKTLGEAMKHQRMFTKELHPIIYYAERNGQLGEQLVHYGLRLEKDWIDVWIQRLKWLEPLLLIVIGALIAYLFLALFTPIMQLIEVL